MRNSFLEFELNNGFDELTWTFESLNIWSLGLKEGFNYYSLLYSVTQIKLKVFSYFLNKNPKAHKNDLFSFPSKFRLY